MKKEKLSCEKARKICIIKSLVNLGHFPKRETEKEAWYLSPFRSETQPSFKVSKVLNRWYDFGVGKGGNIIDLFCLIKNCEVKEALAYLEEEPTLSTFPSPVNPGEKMPSLKSKIKINAVTFLTHPALLNYLYKRKISLKIARQYCREVSYYYKEKSFFAIGFENHKGGWELRNKYYKNSSSPKTYSFLERDAEQLVITEGMFDFLSLATIDEKLVGCSDAIILNSLAFIQQIERILQNYERVLLFLDNDAAGEKATHNLTSRYTNIENCSNRYKGYVDLNEKLKNEKV